MAYDSDEPSAVLVADGWLIIPQILACKAQKKDLLTFKNNSQRPVGTPGQQVLSATDGYGSRTI